LFLLESLFYFNLEEIMNTSNEKITETKVEIMETLLRCGDIARLLNISRSKAYFLVQSGEIRSIRIGSSVRVQPRDLKDYVSGLLLQGAGGIQ
jgi:excisionase family DNA binding protein